MLAVADVWCRGVQEAAGEDPGEAQPDPAAAAGSDGWLVARRQQGGGRRNTGSILERGGASWAAWTCRPEGRRGMVALEEGSREEAG